MVTAYNTGRLTAQIGQALAMAMQVSNDNNIKSLTGCSNI